MSKKEYLSGISLNLLYGQGLSKQKLEAVEFPFLVRNKGPINDIISPKHVLKDSLKKFLDSPKIICSL